MTMDRSDADQVSAMDITAGIQQLDDHYGGTFAKSFISSLQKTIDPLRVSVAEWKDAIEFILGRHDKRPSKNQIIDGIRAVRGEAKGAGTIDPPAKGSGFCPTCKGEGALWYEKKGYRSIILCSCDNGASKRFYMTHTYVPGKEEYGKERHDKKGYWRRNSIPEPPTLEAVKASGVNPADITDKNRCRITEGREEQRARNYETLRNLHAAGKWIPPHVMEIMEAEDAEGPNTGVASATMPTEVGSDAIPPF